ncbi:hypothetical protein FACS1894163_03840 [Spirochaetia bacterium]|nr:hypothetical protein FACS1894163_03840 [Spirochaetia bacterium]
MQSIRDNKLCTSGLQSVAYSFGLKLAALTTLIAVLALVGCNLEPPAALETTATETATAEVSNLQATPGNAQVTLTWTAPTNTNIANVVITYTNGTAPVVVEKGILTKTITGLTNGSAYTFTVKTEDTTGKTSTGKTVTATPTPSVASALTGSVSIDGTVAVGETLYANTGSLGGSGTISYQWKRGAVNIGTNSKGYVLVTDDVGAAISVVVSRAGNSGSITGGPTAAVIPPLTGTVSISGTAILGETLTANTGSLGGSGTISYQWKRWMPPVVWELGGVDIDGATSQTYTLVTADLDKAISVEVSRAGNSEYVIGGPTAAVILPPLTGSVTIDVIDSNTGKAVVWGNRKPVVGESLTANTDSLGGSGTIFYQWKWGGGNNGTNSTYTLMDYDIGTPISVEVSRAGNSGSIFSNSVMILPQVATPTVIPFVPEDDPLGAGVMYVGALITLSSGTPGATIHFTTDGSPPTPSYGTRYTGPFTLSSLPATVKAIAVKEGMADSAVMTVNYIPNDILNYTIADTTSSDLTVKFGRRATASVPLTEDMVQKTFADLHRLISNPKPGDDFAFIIRLGDYIDLPSLTVGSTTITDMAISQNYSRLLRLIVVGKNSFKRDSPGAGFVTLNNPNAPNHVVFQFHNIPVTHVMDDINTNAGYSKSTMRTFLTGNFLPGLKAATGLTADTLWEPTRRVMGLWPSADQITDALWLPTEWEMFGVRTFAHNHEVQAGQARLEYYDSNWRRIKYNKDGTINVYWLASRTSLTYSNPAGFVAVNPSGEIITRSPNSVVGVAPAFCVR